MLARSFRTPKQLKLKKEHFDALVRTLNALESGQVQHFPTAPGRDHIAFDAEDFRRFRKLARQGHVLLLNMCWWRETYGCGTIGCIGGLAERLSGLGEGVLTLMCHRDPTNQLHNLFFGFDGGTWCVPSLGAVTVAQAAMALRSYLTTGKPNWRKIVGEG